MINCAVAKLQHLISNIHWRIISKFAEFALVYQAPAAAKLQFTRCCQISLQHLILNLHWTTISIFKEFPSVYQALHCCQTSVHHLLPHFIDHCHTVKCHCVLPHCSSDISYFMFAWQYKIADLAVSLDWCRLVTCHVLKYEPSTTPSRPGLHQSLATIDQFETWSASLLMLTTCLGYCSRISRGWDEVWEKERETGMRWGSLMLLFTLCTAWASNALCTLLLSTAPGIIGHGIGLAAPAYAAPAYTTHLAAAPVLKWVMRPAL